MDEKTIEGAVESAVASMSDEQVGALVTDWLTGDDDE